MHFEDESDDIFFDFEDDNTSDIEEMYFGRIIMDAIEMALDLERVDENLSLKELGANRDGLLAVQAEVSCEMMGYHEYPVDLPLEVFVKYWDIPIKDLIKKLNKVTVSDILGGREI